MKLHSFRPCKMKRAILDFPIVIPVIHRSACFQDLKKKKLSNIPFLFRESFDDFGVKISHNNMLIMFSILLSDFFQFVVIVYPASE